MRLSELNPRWLINEPDRKLFIFICPHCHRRWLSCKNFTMSTGAQHELFQKALENENMQVVVPMKESVNWKMENPESWETITITPSIDASPSGDWHGFITSGEVK